MSGMDLPVVKGSEGAWRHGRSAFHDCRRTWPLVEVPAPQPLCGIVMRIIGGGRPLEGVVCPVGSRKRTGLLDLPPQIGM